MSVLKKRSLEKKKEELEEERKMIRNSREEEFMFMEQLKEVCKQKSEAFEMQFDEYIGQLQQCKDSIISELSSRLKKEMAKLQNTIDDIDRQENDLDKAIKEITDIMKCDKLKVLKESPRLKDKKPSKLGLSSRSDNHHLPSSSRNTSHSCCFIECTLKLDSAALETAINNTHLMWEADTDMFSPKHLSDRFTQLYEKEWKSAYMESSSKDEVVKQLFNILTDSYTHADLCSETHLENLTYRVLQPDIDVQIGEFNMHGFNDVEIQQDLPSFSSTLPSSGLHGHLSTFANKCFELTFALRLQDPPLFLDIIETDKNDGHGIEKEVYKLVKRRGRKTKTIVWPPLYLYKGGPILTKGVMFIPV